MNPCRNKTAITARVKEEALALGFDLVRITSAQSFSEDRKIALQRIDEGLMDGLPWYNESRVRRGTEPEELLPGAKSIICLALNYFPGPPKEGDSAGFEPGPAGQIARYARGRDYHRVMKRKMRDLVAVLNEAFGTTLAARWYVDDGPMLDRAAAARAGLGWFGKNSNILTSELGSWVFLGQIVTDMDLEADYELRKTCGSCVTCIDSCPTGAIVAPYVIDNTRCISYQTIENRGPIPLALRPKMLDWVFGCDICQEVCPVNRKAHPTSEPSFANQGLAVLDLVELLDLTDEEFKKRFAGTPIMRAKRVGLQRNACVALGNLREASAVPALSKALAIAEPLVKQHAAWALGEIGGNEAIACLEQAAVGENESEVLAEITAAIRNLKERLEKSAAPPP